ncbi:MAG: haloalkane dehalogenase [Pseudomonadales bacterium]
MTNDTPTPQPRDGVLRTPDRCFEAIADYPWPPAYLEIEPGLRMAYVEAGPGDAAETVLLLHGEPTWGYLYRKMIGPLAGAGLRVIVPDLIGFGRSDKPTAATAYTYSGHVAWMKRFIERLDLQGMTFFGQDWGGLIGARLVAENAARFTRAVFSNTALPHSRMPFLPGLKAQERLEPERLKALLGMDWRDTVDDQDRIDPARVQALVYPTPANYFPAWRVYSQEVAELRPSKIVPGWCLAPLSASARAAYDAPFPSAEFTAGPRRFPLLVPLTADDPERARCDAAWAVLEKWQNPVLTLWGDHCPFTNGDLGQSFRSRIPGARLEGIDHAVLRASHFIQEDAGADVAARMIDFIRQMRPDPEKPDRAVTLKPPGLSPPVRSRVGG